MRALRVLLRKEFLQIRRDPTILRLLFVMPFVQLVLLANAASFEVKESRLWVVDQDRTTLSAGLVERLRGTGRFIVVGSSVRQEDGNAALMTGHANAIVAIPAGFAREIQQTRRGTVQLAFNAEDGAQAGVASSYATEIVSRYGAELGAQLLPQALGGADRDRPVRGVPRLDVHRRYWFNPALEYRWYMVPGILVQLVTIGGTFMSALNIVREKEAGTLDQLNVTPINRTTFIAAKLIPFWLIGIVQLTVGLLVAVAVFRIPIEGSLALVYGAAALYLVAALAVGLWVSSVAETQQQAVFVAFSLLMVYILMSGLFTPIRSMPDWAQDLAFLNPLMHFIALMRGVMLKGANAVDVLPRLAALAVGAGVLMAAAVWRYRKGAA
ncbi:ABC transporter permease [Pseudogemmatithrix spongiicola]|uniref:Transport permease protein n=1 Tax=Pseudogemmatithrix spongiicola TaxID=3062599 RepID=A0AA49JYW8_9BACT|nr:ABC transporter permease [Gemmatimonadaceae bacterium 'strain 138']WKW14342.1 ABC transporter permease [Gemmatimonadaceae bacterium 'strain 318']